MLELFHTVNSVCAQKIRIQLAEKGLPWSSRLMTLRGDQFDPEYLKLNPNAVVPTLLHDGRPVIESSVILYYIEDCFSEPSLMPAPPLARAKVRLFNKLIDEKIHNACTVLTFATALRPQFLTMNADELERYLSHAPDKKRSHYKRDVIAKGLESAFAVEAIEHYVTLLRWIEASLSESPYLAGDALSLADIAVFPYVFRLDLLRLSAIWRQSASIGQWYERVGSRKAVQGAIRDAMTPADLAPFEKAASDPWPAIAASASYKNWAEPAHA